MATLRKPLALRITAQSDCERCGGTGFNIKHEYDGTFHQIEVKIAVCSCVRIAPLRSKKETNNVK